MYEQPAADGRAGIDARLVTRLIAAQFPQWRDLPVRPVQHDGWDNRTYRLGEAMSVRLPTAARYVTAVEKEHRWLPMLGPLLPVSVPAPLAVGQPGEGYPYPWSIRGWLTGQPARSGSGHTCNELAVDVANFLTTLHRVDATGGPEAGEHSFWRGADLAHYDAETRQALLAVTGEIDTCAAEALWNDALAATWHGAPKWFHGDMAAGNLLVAGGRLAAVIDFGTCGVGDPACDFVVAWTLFSGRDRAVFRDAVCQRSVMWARARGWALWKSLITLAEDLGTDPDGTEANCRVISELLADDLA